jgi:hypothetical protein
LTSSSVASAASPSSANALSMSCSTVTSSSVALLQPGVGGGLRIAMLRRSTLKSNRRGALPKVRENLANEQIPGGLRSLPIPGLTIDWRRAIPQRPWPLAWAECRREAPRISIPATLRRHPRLRPGIIHARRHIGRNRPAQRLSSRTD